MVRFGLFWTARNFLVIGVRLFVPSSFGGAEPSGVASAADWVIRLGREEDRERGTLSHGSGEKMALVFLHLTIDGINLKTDLAAPDRAIRSRERVTESSM